MKKFQNKFSVLVYHHIVPDNFSVESFPPGDQPYFSRLSEFYSHVDYLTENNFLTLTIDEINKQEQKQQSVKKVAMTFDDGQISDYNIVFPYLLERNMKATFYIVTDIVGRKGYVDWAQLKEMQKNGMDIGSHSCSHPCLLDSKNNDLQNELLKSRLILEDRIGCPIRSFSVPFGFCDQNVIDLAMKSGYKTICTSEVKISCFKSESSVYGRFGLRRGDGVCKFKGVVEMEWQIVGKMIIEDKIKSTLKRVLGRGLWGRFRNIILSQGKT